MFHTLTLFALLIRCPAGEAGYCPFAEARKSWTLEEKFLIAERLPEEKCREILDFHDRCLAGAGRNQEIKTAA